MVGCEQGRGGARLLSGRPTFDRQGNLYVTDIPFGRIFRLDRDGEWALVAEYDGWPNGLRVAADGQLLVADYRLGLLRIDPNSGSVTPVLSAVRATSRGLNDLTIASNGDVYFTDQGQTGMDPTGRVYRLTTDGRLERLLDTFASPNGIVLNAAGTHLYVALTRACQVWRVPVTRGAVVGKANVFAQLPGGVSGPDGLAMDIEDGLAIADPGHACVWAARPSRRPTAPDHVLRRPHTHQRRLPRARSLHHRLRDRPDPEGSGTGAGQASQHLA